MFFDHAAIQVDKLLQVVVGETNVCPTATSSVPDDLLVQPPAMAPSHDAGLDLNAMTAVTAQLQALELANAEQRAKLRALELDKAEHETEIKKLREKVIVTTLIPVICGEAIERTCCGEVFRCHHPSILDMFRPRRPVASNNFLGHVDHIFYLRSRVGCHGGEACPEASCGIGRLSECR